MHSSRQVHVADERELCRAVLARTYDSEGDSPIGLARQRKRCAHPIGVAALISAGLFATGCLVGVVFYWEGHENDPAPKLASVVVSFSEQPLGKNCSLGRADCSSSKCCAAPGLQCYAQHKWYAQCRKSCLPGIDPTHWDEKAWTCLELGERSEGEPKTCSGPGEDCAKTGCCTEMGATCFEKAPGWAACKQECIPDSPDLTDGDSKYWSCKKYGSQNPTAAKWVAKKCAQDGEDCSKKGCCAKPGSQCFKQDDYWAECKATCSTEKANEWSKAWSCETIGQLTPSPPSKDRLRVAPWVKDKCAWDETDCKGSRCCLGMNKQCYAKSKYFAMCKETCERGIHPEDKDNTSWTCEELGPRSHGLSIRGSPSLFCWSLMRTTTYEMEIAVRQLNKSIGIFLCDDHLFVSTDDPMVLGTHEGKVVKTLQVDKAQITVSVDGTAGNAKMFINAWNVVIKDGRWNNYAWTIKVDPDAVLIPDRMRSHLSPYGVDTMFILNCNAFPGSPDFPMMYGSLEVLSWKAMQTYANQMWLCMRDQAGMIPLWGEDRFMKKCLDLLGVTGIFDESMVGDGTCVASPIPVAVDCASGNAAYHPLKSVDLWQGCWDTVAR